MNEQEQMAFFYEIFDASLPRLGPGDDASTLQALELVKETLVRDGGVTDAGGLKVLDLGCGNGAQTLALAMNTDWSILAVDNHQPYLGELERRTDTVCARSTVETCLADMRELDLGDVRFDLIWAEGSLFVMGFHQGLARCYDLLVPGGCLAASELCWFRNDVPEECLEFFGGEYPSMKDVDANLTMIEESGFVRAEHFRLPESAWLVNYYQPLESRLGELCQRLAGDREKMEIIERIQREIDVYREYSDYYGYEFFVAQRPKSE